MLHEIFIPIVCSKVLCSVDFNVHSMANSQLLEVPSSTHSPFGPKFKKSLEMEDDPDLLLPSHFAAGSGNVVASEISIFYFPNAQSSVSRLTTKSMMNAGVSTKWSALA